MPRQHEQVVNILLLILTIVLILLVIWTYYLLESITPQTAAIQAALNFT